MANWPQVEVGRSERGLSAHTLIDQEVIKYLVFASNGNVDIQSRNVASVSEPEGVAIEGRLICRKCHEIKRFDIGAFLAKSRLMDELKWSENHKHETVAMVTPDEKISVPTGNRKLKVVL